MQKKYCIRFANVDSIAEKISSAMNPIKDPKEELRANSSKNSFIELHKSES